MVPNIVIGHIDFERLWCISVDRTAAYAAVVISPQRCYVEEDIMCASSDARIVPPKRRVCDCVLSSMWVQIQAAQQNNALVALGEVSF